MPFVLSCAWALIVAWLISRAFGQRNTIPALKPLSLSSKEFAPFVTVVVPARDEAENIANCLSGLLGQTYPQDRLRIVVVDDQSEDATFAIAAGIAHDYARVCVLKAPPLPPRWVGKPHACWTGTAAAPVKTDWFCFIDADVKTKPEALASAVEAADLKRLDLLSLAPRQELGSFAERIIIPCGLYLLSFCRDLGAVQAAGCSDAAATGQFLLIRASAYNEIGGHQAVSTEICEDVALARTIKRAGHRVLLYDGKAMISARMYDGWKTLWPGFTKNIVEMLGGPAASLTLALTALVLAWATVFVPLIVGTGCTHGDASACAGLPIAAAASAAALGLHIAGAVYFRIPFWYGLLFPIGYTIGVAMTIDSLSRHLRGRVQWKGRTYP